MKIIVLTGITGQEKSQFAAQLVQAYQSYRFEGGDGNKDRDNIHTSLTVTLI